MSNIIQFLESMGKDATLSNMSSEVYATTVKALDVSDMAQHALLNRDHEALNNTISGYKKMMMILMPAENDDEGEGKGKDDDQKKEEEEISIN